MATELLQAVVEDGVRLTHFFNGRVLTAEDLRREQDAARARHRGLALGIGDGVVRGMEVRVANAAVAGAPGGTTLDGSAPSVPTVRVEAGIAFNRDGDRVELPRAVVLRLVTPPAEGSAAAAAFAPCDPASATVSLTNGGFYLLVAQPADAYSTEQVPGVELTGEGVASHCASRYTQAGASLALVAVPEPASGAGGSGGEVLSLLGQVRDAAAGAHATDATQATRTAFAKLLSRLRSAAAYWLLGWPADEARIAGLAAGTAPAPLTPLEAMRAGGLLAACQVPLSLLFISRYQLEFADTWSARRVPAPAEDRAFFGAGTGVAPRTDAIAMFRQFREHAGAFLGASPLADARTVRAREWFAYLPPTGIIPVHTGDAGAAASGFEPSTFFGRSGGPFIGGNWPGPVVPVDWVQQLSMNALDDIPTSMSGSPHLRFYRFGTPESPRPYVMFRTRRWLPSQTPVLL